MKNLWGKLCPMAVGSAAIISCLIWLILFPPLLSTPHQSRSRFAQSCHTDDLIWSGFDLGVVWDYFIKGRNFLHLFLAARVFLNYNTRLLTCSWTYTAQTVLPSGGVLHSVGLDMKLNPAQVSGSFCQQPESQYKQEGIREGRRRLLIAREAV